VPFEISAHPINLPDIVRLNISGLRYRVLHFLTRVVPNWADLKDFYALARDTKSKIQLWPNVRRGSALLNEGRHRLLKPLRFKFTQSHVHITFKLSGVAEQRPVEARRAGTNFNDLLYDVPIMRLLSKVFFQEFGC
jgi:hypothetical protein